MQSTIDLKRRHFLLRITQFLGGVGAFFAALPFISSWLPSARAKAAGAPVEVNVKNILPGQMLTIEWRGRPVWIMKRTPVMLELLGKHNTMLRDPESLVPQQPAYADNATRSRKQELFVAVGVCTHLGCIPKFKPEVGSVDPTWPGGFFCPCHGSRFDLAGRVFKGVPAPINLEIPPYSYLNDDVIVIGVDQDHKADV